jgi:peptide/nickel transport system permease protein
MKWPKRQLVIGTTIVVFFYLIAIFADLLAPYDYRSQSRGEPMAPPTPLRFRDAQGRWNLRPFIYARRLVDPLERRYEEDTDRAYPIALFTCGYSYKLFGLFTTDVHVFGAQDANTRVYLLGADGLGRDHLSRLLIATRFSLLVGPLGTALASALGVLIGLVAGYAGRWVDAALMRAADVMMALPALVLILAARAAFPLELPPSRAATLLVSIFVALGWAEMARLARGLTMELRQREFTLAAVSLGCSPARVLFRHILPNAARPLVTQAFLTLPVFLLAETALSFLGVGLQEPEASWGGLLTEAADITLLERAGSWAMLAPAFAITLFVLGSRLLSDGLEKLSARHQKFVEG